MEADADRPGALVERRPDVDVLAEVVATNGLDHDRRQLVDRWDIVHEEDPAGVANPLEVLAEEYRVELLLVRVPVRADTLEGGGPVHEGVSHDADLGLGHRDVVALEIADEVVEAAGRGGDRGRRGGRGTGLVIRACRWLVGEHQRSAPAGERGSI